MVTDNGYKMELLFKKLLYIYNLTLMTKCNKTTRLQQGAYFIDIRYNILEDKLGDVPCINDNIFTNNNLVILI